MTQDPRRFSDDAAEPNLARALREAQGDVLSPQAVARVRTALTVAGVAAAGAGLGAAPRSSLGKLLMSTARLRIGLAGLGIAGLGLAGAAGVAWMRHTPSPAASSDQAIETAGAALPSAGVSASTARPAETSGAETPEPPAALVAPVASTAVRSISGAPAQPAAAPPSPREGALLLEARRALGTDPARALALVRAHEREFPRSQLGRERARIAAEARQRLEK